MPVVEISVIAGRTAATKARLIAELTAATVRALGVDPARVRVLVREIPADGWGVGGVTRAEEVP